MNLAQRRNAQARAFSSSVDLIVALSQPFADRQGVDLQALLDEAAVRRAEERRQLAERLQQSVLPLFIQDGRVRPDRLGSCVLVRLDSSCYAFTAAHVLRDAGSAQLLAPPQGKGEKLLPLQWSTGLTVTADRNDLDVGVLVLPASALGAFEQRVFLTGLEVDEDDQPDEPGLASFYSVLGYSASRTQVKVFRETRRIDQKSFQAITHPVASAEYFRENLLQSDHLLLDFDHKDIARGGGRTPPWLQGVSGGGIFQISRSTFQGPLVAIATRNPRNSRLLVGTRIKHFLRAARELRATAPPEFFE
jgi:hypothetical protein